MKNIVVLISGNGSNLQAIIDACKQKKLTAPFGQYSATRPTRSALSARGKRAFRHALEASQFAGREAFDRELVNEIDAYAPDVVVLAGYMRILKARRLSNTSPGDF